MNLKNVLLNSILFIAVFIRCGFSTEPLTLPLYADGEMDDAIVHTIPEETKTGESSHSPLGYIRGFYNVSTPELTVYPAADQTDPTPAIVVYPGGGFSHVTIDKEGTMLAAWLNEIGITAIVVKYRTLPKGMHRSTDEGRKLINYIIDDAVKALCIVNENAADWNIDPEKIGIMGFSAGGNICTSIITQTHSNHIALFDSYKPAFACLVYPGLSQQHVDNINSQLPPIFIACARDDKVTPAVEALDFYTKLITNDVPAELHVFINGAHGFGMYQDRGVVANWPLLFRRWMVEQKILPKTE